MKTVHGRRRNIQLRVRTVEECLVLHHLGRIGILWNIYLVINESNLGILMPYEDL